MELSVELHDDEFGSDGGIDGDGGDPCGTVGAGILSEGMVDAVEILIGLADVIADIGAASFAESVCLEAL